MNTDMTSGPTAPAAGLAPAGQVPPSSCQVDHVPPPSLVHLCHTCASVPRANTSILALPHDTAPGPDASTPPSEVHPAHTPFCDTFSHTALSAPRANTSRIPLSLVT